MQSQAAMWAREAQEMRDFLHFTDARLAVVVRYRRERAIQAQHYAAMYSAAIVSNL